MSSPQSDKDLIQSLSNQVTSLSDTVSTLSATITRQNDLIQKLLNQNATRAAQPHQGTNTVTTPRAITKKGSKPKPILIHSTPFAPNPSLVPSSVASGSGTWDSPGLPPPAYSSPYQIEPLPSRSHIGTSGLGNSVNSTLAPPPWVPMSAQMQLSSPTQNHLSPRIPNSRPCASPYELQSLQSPSMIPPPTPLTLNNMHLAPALPSSSSRPTSPLAPLNLNTNTFSSLPTSATTNSTTNGFSLPTTSTSTSTEPDPKSTFPMYGKQWLPRLLSAWWYPDPDNGIPIPLREWDLESRLASRDKWKKAEWIARGWHIIKGHPLMEQPMDQPEILNLAQLDDDVSAWEERWGDKQNTSLALIRQAIRDDPAGYSWAPVKFGEAKKRKSGEMFKEKERNEKEYRFIEWDPVKRACKGLWDEEVMVDYAVAI